MKKKLLLGLLIGTAPFMLAACGSKKDSKKDKEAESNTKTITCTGEREGKIAVTFKYNTKEETVTSGTMEYEMDISKYTAEEQAVIKKLNLCDSFKNDELYSECKPLNSDSSLGVNLTFNLEKLTTDLSVKEKSVDNFAKAYEDEMDVKCEIK